MHLKTILLGFFLCFNIAFCQEQNDSLLQLEKQADSIYFNFSEYSSKTDIVHGLNLYDDALKLNRNP